MVRINALCQQCLSLLVSYHYSTYSTHKSYVLLIPRDPYNPSKMTKNIKEVTVEAIEN